MIAAVARLACLALTITGCRQDNAPKKRPTTYRADRWFADSLDHHRYRALWREAIGGG